MINVTIDSLRDYQACPLYYKFEHVEHYPLRTTQLKETRQLFKETLTSVVNFFFFKKMSMQEPSYKTLEGRWEKKWIKDVSPIEMVTTKTSATNAYPTDAYYTTKATAALRIFHNWFSRSEKSEVVMIEEAFTVPLTNKVALNGQFDCVLRAPSEDGGTEYQIYVWSINLGNKSIDYWASHFASLDYAFRYRNNFDPKLKVSYYLWDFTDNKPGVKQYVVEPKDHQILKSWADDMAGDLYGKNEEELEQAFYPIRGLSAFCTGCKYDKPCRKWVRKDKEKS